MRRIMKPADLRKIPYILKVGSSHPSEDEIELPIDPCSRPAWIVTNDLTTRERQPLAVLARLVSLHCRSG